MHRLLTFFLLVLAFLLWSPAVLLAAGYVYSIGYLWHDFRGLRIRRLDMSSLFGAGLLLHAVSHTIALNLTDPVSRQYFLLLYKPQHLFEGLAIFHVGSMIILESMRYYSRVDLKDISLENKVLDWGQILLLSILFFIIPKYVSLTSAGTIGSIMSLLVLGSLFLLSFEAHRSNRHLLINICITYTLLLSIHAYKTSYLRYEILLPWLAYFFGEFLARKNVLLFSIQSKVFVVILFLVIPPLFTYLGKTRATESIASREVTTVIQRLSEDESSDEGETILSRLSYINQMTNIVHLVTTKGFYAGQTLEYYSYAFIPRFLWPEKPIIAQGQWFALEANLAYRNRKGKINNSVNMTVPGEFYLNFGWPGVLVGCWCFGFFFAFIWNRIGGDSLAGWTFRFLLLFVAISGLGADLQIMVTYTAYFLLYWAFVNMKRLIGVN